MWWTSAITARGTDLDGRQRRRRDHRQRRTGQALILQGVTKSQLSAKNFFHAAQVREDRLNEQLASARLLTPRSDQACPQVPTIGPPEAARHSAHRADRHDHGHRLALGRE